MTTHEKAPVESTVAPQLVMVAPKLMVVVIVTPAVNPLPETVTDPPLGP